MPPRQTRLGVFRSQRRCGNDPWRRPRESCNTTHTHFKPKVQYYIYIITELGLDWKVDIVPEWSSRRRNIQTDETADALSLSSFAHLKYILFKKSNNCQMKLHTDFFGNLIRESVFSSSPLWGSSRSFCPRWWTRFWASLRGCCSRRTILPLGLALGRRAEEKGKKNTIV